jgi:predicted NAD/FAD-binding protein
LTATFIATDVTSGARRKLGPNRRLNIAVIGSGISGLSASWLLSQRHRVTLLEGDDRLGGHSHTVDVSGHAVDTGFIVFNHSTYPNLTALLDHVGVDSRPSDMTFAVSLGDGRLEYSGTGLFGLFAQARNLASPRFWGMLRDLVRFYREAPRSIVGLSGMTLDQYLDAAGLGEAFRNDHLYPMAAAIWSTPSGEIGSYPAASFVRFCESHGLLKLRNRPIWRTVVGGSRAYVHALAGRIQEVVRNYPVRKILRTAQGVELVGPDGHRRHFDHVVLATHADTALALLEDPSDEERRLLGSFHYTLNHAVLHSDRRLMPRRRRIWSSWNYLTREGGDERRLAVTYWMNRLQGFESEQPLFVTLNPHLDIAAGAVVRRMSYTHPRFDTQAIDIQQELWSLQGIRRTWFCGAYFGAGFHEDGLQAGLAVAEELGGVRRPWSVANESGRIHVRAGAGLVRNLEAA